MKLSVIIVNYNVEYFLEQCLNSVRKASHGLDIETFVVDNNSIDGSVNMVREKFPEVHLIANKDNPGFSKANNQAIRISNGEYVLLLNPDTIVEEDTFKKCINFMDEHPDSGGLGVKMIDGKGKFLPESKRGLPTPDVAFYKIFGLSSLFPRNRKFAKYHLGYLSKDENHEIEVLSGAFMMMRKEALDKVGLLDEDFFMYGEDIDLSYRIIKGGYKNYYFSDTSIIHYKGESTKKSSVNYVFVFYNAMIIFAKKHFSEKNAKTFSFLINIAIYLRASIAILNRFVKQIAFPFIDFVLILISLFLITKGYEVFRDKGAYPTEVINYALPSYSLIWVLISYLTGAYDKPIKLINSLKGILLGTGIILMVYGLLPKSVQFSRIIILLGAAGGLISMLVSRGLAHLSGNKDYSLNKTKNQRFIIVGKHDEADRIKTLLSQTTPITYSAILAPEEIDDKGYDGHLNQIGDMVHINKVSEVIFCARDISAQRIIELMSEIQDKNIDFKIAQPDSLYLIGSNSIHTSGDLYLMEVNNIDKKSNLRNKRLLDFCLSIVLLATYPVFLVITGKPSQLLKNIFSVLFARKSWVGYAQSEDNQPLPPIRKSVLKISDHLKNPSLETQKKLNVIYAKDYSLNTDVKTILKNLKKLGN